VNLRLVGGDPSLEYSVMSVVAIAVSWQVNQRLFSIARGDLYDALRKGFGIISPSVEQKGQENLWLQRADMNAKILSDNSLIFNGCTHSVVYVSTTHLNRQNRQRQRMPLADSACRRHSRACMTNVRQIFMNWSELLTAIISLIEHFLLSICITRGDLDSHYSG
jgi:hypothetical protein